MQNLIKLDSMAFKEFINSFDLILTDINGVLWNDSPIPNVKETIVKLKEIGKNIYFVSNNSFQSIEQYKKEFLKIGIDLDLNDLVYPTITLIDYLKSIQFNKKVFCISGQSLQKLLNDAGIQCVSGKKYCDESLSAGIAEIMDDPEVGAVYVDVDININYIKLCKAVTILKRPDVLYIVGAIDKFISVTSNIVVLGSGAFIDIISQYSKRDPIVLGKPSEYLKNLVMKCFNITNPKRVLFIGDVLEQDMAFGSMCGFQKVFVLSGIDSLENAKSVESRIKPDYYIDSFGDLLHLL